MTSSSRSHEGTATGAMNITSKPNSIGMHGGLGSLADKNVLITVVVPIDANAASAFPGS